MYFALYRKWRPKLFKDVIDQAHITSTLKNEVKFNKIAHSYLFTGPKGTGKTTCARILAKAVNCLNPLEGEPCCQCEICKSIENGTTLDIVELDGASSNSVNDVKILKDEANFVPSHCKFKVYIIDEVHMLSVSAFNALLKIMEEPPLYVIFILATTEVKKVLPTIISRCQRFDFKRVSLKEIAKRLIYISEKENFILSEKAAIKISSMSDGSLRDAISILDECSVHGKEIDLSLINEIFSLANEEELLSLLMAIYKNDYCKAFNLLETFYENGKEVQSFCLDLIKFFRELLVYKINQNSNISNLKSITFSSFMDEEILNFSKKLTLEFINKILKDCLNCFEDLKLSINSKLKFELLIFDLCLKFEKFFNSSNENKTKKIQVNASNKNENLIKKNKTEEILNNNDTNSNGNLNFSENSKLEPLKNWDEILAELKNSLKNDMISGFLVDSEAFVSGDKLFINFKNPVVGKKVLDKKNDISSIIKQKTGHNYRIFIKKSDNSNFNSNSLSKNRNLDNFLNMAKKLKIEVDEI